MMNHPLTSLSRYKVTQVHREPRDTNLARRIGLLRTVVASLSQAVEELEDIQLPPLTEQFDFYDEVRQFEILLIRKALRTTRGSQVAAARLLKLRPTTLNAKIKSYGLFAAEREG
ncbi:MAG TPA: helix-turn-helix domain-containing protein [Pyrinomonadaceae bacterium]|nr:helix-turn-helix domain-containing protein [Pyrinomonadaceae bacterium]